MMNYIEELNDTMSNLLKHPLLKKILLTYSKNIWELHTADPGFSNYLTKDGRIYTWFLIINFISSNNISSLTELYDICKKNKICGKNKVISLLDYMNHTGRMSYLKCSDRRMKKPVMTDKGKEDIYRYIGIFLPVLKMYDSKLNAFSRTDEIDYQRYFKRLANLLAFSHLSDKSRFFNGIFDMPSASAFTSKIYIDICEDRIELNSPLLESYFTGLYHDIGASKSHVRNMLTALVSSGLIDKIKKRYLINDSFLLQVEEAKVFYLSNYYLLVI